MSNLETVQFKDKEYLAIQASGNAARFIMPFAKEFCKGKGYDIGCNRIEWALEGAIPIDLMFNNGFHATNLPEANVDFCFCMTGDNLVLTKKGYKEIRLIKTGDLVWTHKGRWRKVVDLYKFNDCKDIYKIITVSNPLGTKVSGNHPILVIDSIPKERNKTLEYSKMDKNKTYFTETRDISETEYAFINIPNYLKDIEYFDLGAILPKNKMIEHYNTIIKEKEVNIHLGDKYFSEKYGLTRTIIRGWIYHKKQPYGYYINGDDMFYHSSSIDFKFNKNLLIDDDLMRLFGYWLADGSITSKNRQIMFHFNKNEYEYIKDVQEIINSKFNIECTDIRTNEGCSTIRYCHKVLWDIFNAIFGICRANSKKIPPFLLWINPKKQMQLIEGYYRGDGTMQGKTIRIVSINYKMLEDLRLMLLRNGILAGITRTENRQSTIKGRTITPSKYSYILGYTLNPKTPKRNYVDSNNAFFKIKNKHKQEQAETVYGIKVEDDESYYTPMLMNHNSSHCLEHLPNWVEALDYWIDTLKVGGILFLYLPSYEQEYWRPYSNRKHIHILFPEFIADYLSNRNDIGKFFVSGDDLNASFSVVAEKI